MSSTTAQVRSFCSEVMSPAGPSALRARSVWARTPSASRVVSTTSVAVTRNRPSIGTARAVASFIRIGTRRMIIPSCQQDARASNPAAGDPGAPR